MLKDIEQEFRRETGEEHGDVVTKRKKCCEDSEKKEKSAKLERLVR